MATVILSHNSSLEQVADILGLLVQDGLGGPVALDGLEPLRSLHLPGYDERPSLCTHTACSECKQMFNKLQRHTCCALHDYWLLIKMGQRCYDSDAGAHISGPTGKAVHLLLEDNLKLL